MTAHLTLHPSTRGPVALITLSNPPVNGLGLSTRSGILAALQQALANPEVVGVVLMGEGTVFCGGADIREFGTDKAFGRPTLHEVNEALEAVKHKPVVAALHGVAMGGGLELAMACHRRLALAGTQLALPEVHLGLIPGAGGTQRLPRLVGVAHAIDMVTSGRSVKAEDIMGWAGQRLLDGVVPSDLLAHAVGLVESMAREGGAVSACDLPAPERGDDALWDHTRQALQRRQPHLPAALRAVDSVEAATRLTFQEGLSFEREAFVALMNSTTSKAQRHAFFGERAAAKIPGVNAQTPLRPVAQVGVIGAGTMGGGIAMSALNAGYPVVLLETRAEALERGVATIRRLYQAQVDKGKLKAEHMQDRLQRLQPTLDMTALSTADLVVEAVFEDMDVKQQVFRQLDGVAKAGAILATNTSTLDVDRIAEVTGRPQDVVGLHFFSPAHVMKLLEVVRGRQTDVSVLATVMQWAKRLKKTAVVSGVCDGFIGNRMLEQYVRQAFFLLDEGCSPAQIDRAMEAWGMAMGPLRVGDLAGNDIGWAIRKRRYIDKPHVRYSRVGDRLCELGRFGQKTGAGWYDYAPGQREPLESAVVAQMLVEHRAALGITPRDIADDEIVHRLVLALVNEGVHLLSEGIASKASDIDMVYLTGYGFPLHRGGPLFYADTLGLPQVIEHMGRFATNPMDDAGFWTPAPMLVERAAAGRGLLD